MNGKPDNIEGGVSRPVCPCHATIDVECDIPPGLSHTGQRRTKVCGIDKCLAPLIYVLQAAGIATTGCCCGHGDHHGTIELEVGTRLIVIWPWANEPVPPGALRSERTLADVLPFLLREQSEEIGRLGHPGWRNTMIAAAGEIERLNPRFNQPVPELIPQNEAKGDRS
jgi:hypothetical protein